MINHLIGTPGNDARPSAEDLRPGWFAGSQPESLHRARAGSSGVRADQQRGVHGHAVNPVPEDGVISLQLLQQLFQAIMEQLQLVQTDAPPVVASGGQTTRASATPATPATNSLAAAPLRDDNPWLPVAGKKRNRRSRKSRHTNHSRGPSEDPNAPPDG